MQKKLEVDGKPVRICLYRGIRAHARTDRRTNRKHNASDTHGMGGGVAHVARPAPKRFHPSSDWRALEACCRPWTWWCNDATALAGYATTTTTMKGKTNLDFTGARDSEWQWKPLGHMQV